MPAFTHICVLTAIAAAVFPAPPASSDPSPRERTKRRVLHIAVPADLDTARVAHAIDEHLTLPERDRPDTVLLELSGNASRLDIVHAIAVSIRECPAPTIVWLRDAKDRHVGAGQAVLGLVAHECWIDRTTSVLRRPADDRSDLTPKAVALEPLSAELLQWAGAPSKDNPGDPLLPRLLLTDPAPMWAVAHESAARPALRLTPTDPGSKAVKIHEQISGERSLILRLDSTTATGLGLTSGPAARVADMFHPRDISPIITTTTPIRVNLAQLIADATAGIAELDKELQSIEASLKAKPRDQRSNTSSFYQDLGARGLSRTAHAREHLETCEKLLTDDPEIQRTPPPGAGALSCDPDDHPAAWRKVFQKRRDQIASIEKKARALQAK